MLKEKALTSRLYSLRAFTLSTNKRWESQRFVWSLVKIPCISNKHSSIIHLNRVRPDLVIFSYMIILNLSQPFPPCMILVTYSHSVTYTKWFPIPSCISESCLLMNLSTFENQSMGVHRFQTCKLWQNQSGIPAVELPLVQIKDENQRDLYGRWWRYCAFRTIIAPSFISTMYDLTLSSSCSNIMSDQSKQLCSLQQSPCDNHHQM